MISARRLLEWGDLDERRRRRVRRGPGGWPPIVWSVLVGAGLSAEVMRSLGVFGHPLRGEATFVDASRLWLATVIAGHVLVVFGTPFRMFWRRDSALLGRLPLHGGPLFAVATVRTVRSAGLAALPCAMAAVAFGPWLAWEVTVRHVLCLSVASLWAGLFAPAAVLAAGAVVASDRARAMLDSVGGGEIPAPKSSWLGILPGLVASGLALVLIGAGDWIVGADATAIGPAMPVLGASAAVAIAAFLWAAARADAVMLVATREVAALDQERLAHVERTRPSALERAMMGRLEPRARLLFDKDARLLRRRFPMPYFLGVVGVAVLWILAASAPVDLVSWAAVIVACLGAYGAVMARRLVMPPTEHPRLLRTLPVGGVATARAKRWHAVGYVLAYPVVGAIPVVARAAEPVFAGALLGGIVATAAAVAAVIAGREG